MHARSIILLLSLILIGTGCAASGPSIQFRSEQSGQVFSQQFTHAYFARANGGEYNLVLNDGIVSTSNSSGPISSSQASGLTQTVCIRILWKPLGGSRPDAPSSTNAIIDWQVRGNDPTHNDYLHYRGSGFVAVYDYGDESRFMIRSSHLELANSSGKLLDPLGSNSMTGSFIATFNDGQVVAAMTALKDESAHRVAQSAASFEGPPPRAPSGP